MEIPSLFMGKIIVTLFPFTDIPSGMKPSVAKSSVLTRHPGSALNSWKVPKMPCFCGFYGVGSNEPVDESSGFKRRGKIKLYQRRSYYAYRVFIRDFTYEHSIFYHDTALCTEQAGCLLFLLCRKPLGQILHGNAFAGFLTVIVPSCKTR